MRYDWLLEPVSAGQPCGPDLDEAGDDVYLDYVLTAGSRIPARYYRSDPFAKDKDAPFDRNAVRLGDEVARIDALLAETRDLRLLAIEARFQAFAGDLPSFCDTLAAIAGLTARFWDDVHPQGLDSGDPDAEGKDFTLRQNVLGGLDDFWQVVQPLQHLPLVTDKRLGPLSYRLFAAVSGISPKRPDDPAIEASEIVRSLAHEDNRRECDAAYSAITAAADALMRIRTAFVEHSGHDYVPGFDRLGDALGKMAELLRAARPELLAPAPSTETETPGSEPEPGDEAAPIAETPAVRPTGRIRTHAEAAAALLAVETYFAATEPTSPTLILVHQARLLVGKPLVYAIETLMPEIAGRAVIRFPSGIDFKIPMALMKSLTDKVAIPAEPAPGSDSPANYSATTRDEATSLLADVEFFYKAAEPSSPIPVLIARASSFTNWKFDMILKDLIAPVA